jgi:hypothetical protein
MELRYEAMSKPIANSQQPKAKEYDSKTKHRIEAELQIEAQSKPTVSPFFIILNFLILLLNNLKN